MADDLDTEFSRPQDVALRLHRTIRALAKAFALSELFEVVGREERDLTQGQKRYFGLFIIALWHDAMKLSPNDAVMVRVVYIFPCAVLMAENASMQVELDNALFSSVLYCFSLFYARLTYLSCVCVLPAATHRGAQEAGDILSVAHRRVSNFGFTLHSTLFFCAICLRVTRKGCAKMPRG